MPQLADDEVNQEMFAAGVRLRFYGDYEGVLDTPTFGRCWRRARS